MKKTIIILTLLALGGCATSEKRQQEKFYDLLHITDGYAMKSPTIEDLTKKDFN
tara:strand:+ start:169 stop:330 length:162 start_codon:yes stop_codon:yes gene_type:complete